MRDEFASNTFLFPHRTVTGGLGTKFEEGFLSICGFPMNQSYERDQLVPWLAVHVPIFAGVDRRQLPLLSARKRLDGLGQSRGQSFYFSGRACRRMGIPQVGAHIQVLHAKPVALAYRGFEFLRSRE